MQPLKQKIQEWARGRLWIGSFSGEQEDFEPCRGKRAGGVHIQQGDFAKVGPCPRAERVLLGISPMLEVAGSFFSPIHTHPHPSFQLWSLLSPGSGPGSSRGFSPSWGLAKWCLQHQFWGLAASLHMNKILAGVYLPRAS